MSVPWRVMILTLAIVSLLAADATAATTTTTMYNYSYVGPVFPGGGFVSVSVIIPAPLGKSMVYTGLPSGTYAGNISFTAPTAANSFSLTVQTFTAATDANGSIAAWAIGANSSNLGKGVPTTGSARLIWTINTLALPLPGTWRTADDWATTTAYYLSCAGLKGCEVDDGQPSVVTYSNRVLTGGGKWTVTPVRVTVTCSGGSGGGSGRGGTCPPDHGSVLIEH